MKGTKPLNNTDIHRVSAAFTGTLDIRNRGLLMIGVSTGERISELLSLRIEDVYQNKMPVTDLLFDKSIVKGKKVSRAVPLNNDGRLVIAALVNWHSDRDGDVDEERPLFPSRNGKGQPPMSRWTAHDVLKDAFVSAGLNGPLATHALRKSFAQRLYDRTGDIFAVQEMLGHRNVATTQKYFGINYNKFRSPLDTPFNEIVLIAQSSFRVWPKKP